MDYEAIDKSAFPDGCCHPPGTFVGTITNGRGADERTYDVYVYPQTLFGFSVCLRYGPKVDEYASLPLVDALLIDGFGYDVTALLKARTTQLLKLAARNYEEVARRRKHP